MLCNNAGIERYRRADEYTIDDWNAISETNLRGAFLCTKYAYPFLKKNPRLHRQYFFGARIRQRATNLRLRSQQSRIARANAWHGTGFCGRRCSRECSMSRRDSNRNDGALHQRSSLIRKKR